MRKTKYISKKIVALLMVATLGIGTCTSCAPVAEKASAEVLSSEEESEIAFLTDKLSASSTAGKKETVYVIKDSEGENKEIIVSNWLKNPDAHKELKDKSNLKDIEVVKGEATYTESEGELTWKTEGTDVYYRGVSEEETPVDVKVSYTLDGESKKADELNGASGHLTISFEYINNTGKEIESASGNYTIYQPYMMVSGLVLDNAIASNVQVSGGSLVNDGERTIVFGVGFPGLIESLGLDEVEDEEIQSLVTDKVVVECDVKNYEPVITLTVANGDALNKLGFDTDMEADDVEGQLAELSNGMAQVVNGAAALSEGAKELNDGAGKLSDGVNTLYAGSGELAKGSESLKAGIKALRDGLKTVYDKIPELSKGVGAAYDGSKQLVTGVNTLVGNNDALNAGAKQLADGLDLLNATLNSEESKAKLSALAQGSDAFATNMGTLNAGMQQITAGYSYSAGELKVIIDSLQAMIDAGQFDAQTAAMVGGLIQYYKSLYAQVNTVSGSVAALNSGYASIDGGIDTITASMNQLASSATALSNGAHSLQTGVSSYTAGAKELATGIDTLSKGLYTLNAAVPTLSDGIKKLYEGSKDAYAGAEKLDGGADALYAGTGELKNGVDALTAGIEKLFNGSVELKDGSKKLSDEGVQKLTNLVSENLDKYVERVNNIREYSSEIESYSGSLVETSSVYIFKTE